MGGETRLVPSPLGDNSAIIHPKRSSPGYIGIHVGPWEKGERAAREVLSITSYKISLRGLIYACVWFCVCTRIFRHQ